VRPVLRCFVIVDERGHNADLNEYHRRIGGKNCAAETTPNPLISPISPQQRNYVVMSMSLAIRSGILLRLKPSTETSKE
jgi:hypothetical protein